MTRPAPEQPQLQPHPNAAAVPPAVAAVAAYPGAAVQPRLQPQPRAATREA